MVGNCGDLQLFEIWYDNQESLAVEPDNEAKLLCTACVLHALERDTSTGLQSYVDLCG